MSKQKIAIITGITGQDGAYLAAFLLKKNYQVYGMHRHTSSSNFWRLKTLGILDHKNLVLENFDLLDLSSCVRMLETIKPQEVYNLAAQSFVGISFDQPILTTQINAIGPTNLLEAIRIVNKAIRFYQASTSEMFGQVQKIPQNEATPFYPCSPYGVSKLFAHWLTINYVESYGIYACSGILFNHESPLRGKEFVTRKITRAIADIKSGKDTVLELGNLDAKRDWGHARDFVKGMWAMLQQEKPKSFVLATGQTTSIRDFFKLVVEAANIDIKFSGKGLHECAVDRQTGKVIMRINQQFFRPVEVNTLMGDASLAAQDLGWKPETSLKELANEMLQYDLNHCHG
jgi:GDPmannose 4,6-dehydratase